MAGIETVKIAAEEDGQRLDRVLAARIPALSRSRLKALILDGQVTIKAAVAARTILDPNAPVKSGDIVTVDLPPTEAAIPQGEEIPLTIVYEDDSIIVIDKPKGLVVHPAAGHAKGTLVNAPTRPIAVSSAAISPSSGACPAGPRAPSTPRSTVTPDPETNGRCAKAAARR
jgi:23S rRNA-/tRNA-specific pseudouridylate synthase